MERLIGVEIDDGQAKRVVLDHSGLNLIGERKADGGREIFAPYFLIAIGRITIRSKSTSAS